MLFGPLALGDVAHDAGVYLPPGDVHFTDYKLDWNSRAVLALSRQLTSTWSDHLGLAAFQIVYAVPVVPWATQFWHQHFDIAAYDFFGAVSEEIRRCGIESFDRSTAVDCEDAIHDRVEDCEPISPLAPQQYNSVREPCIEKQCFSEQHKQQ